MRVAITGATGFVGPHLLRDLLAAGHEPVGLSNMETADLGVPYVSCDLTRSWQRFGPVIEAEVKAQALTGGAAPLVIPVHEFGMARLRGTFALVLQKHFSTVGEGA